MKLDNLYRYSFSCGVSGGIVFAENQADAEAKVTSFLADNGLKVKPDGDFNDGELLVWPLADDDCANVKHPDVLELYSGGVEM